MHGEIGGVICDPIGKWLLGFAGHQFIHGSMESELPALYHGLNLAFTHGNTPFDVNIDAKAIILVLHTSHPLYANIIFYCKSLIAQLHDPVILHTYMEQNEVAESLAKHGLQMEASPSITIFAQSPVTTRPVIS